MHRPVVGEPRQLLGLPHAGMHGPFESFLTSTRPFDLESTAMAVTFKRWPGLTGAELLQVGSQVDEDLVQGRRRHLRLTLHTEYDRAVLFVLAANLDLTVTDLEASPCCARGRRS